METEGDISPAMSRGAKAKSRILLLAAAAFFSFISYIHEEQAAIPAATISLDKPVYLPTRGNVKVRPIHSLVEGDAKNYTLHGVDVSRYQHAIDWTAMRKAGVTFAFIKATEGVILADSFYQWNWQGAGSEHIVRGAYHYFVAEKDAPTQAVNFIINVKLAPGDLPPVLDVEVTRGQTAKQIRKGMQEWLTIVQKAYGAKPIIYTSPAFYKKYLAGHFDQYPLWLASYSAKKPTLPKGRWLFWQHSETGRLDGIAKAIDLNVFHGDSAAFRRLCLPGRIPS